MPHTNIKPKTFNKKHAFTQIINYNFNFDIKVDICKDMKLKKEINHINKRPKLQIEKISFQEMADDFSKLRERNKKKKAEEELLYLLRNSTKALPSSLILSLNCLTTGELTFGKSSSRRLVLRPS